MNCTSDTTFDSIFTIHSQLTKLIIAKIDGGIFLPGSFDALLARGFQDKLILLSKIVEYLQELRINFLLQDKKKLLKGSIT
jgi:hypothetical protein